jgi:DNA-binding transcriptional ArsR family regulator
MVVDIRNEERRADVQFHALADATRRDIVRVVLHGEHSVSDLARRYPMSFAAVQKHVAVLERANLVTKRQIGRERLVRGRIDAVRDVARLLDEFESTWRGRMQRFGDVLAEPDTNLDSSEPKAIKANSVEPGKRHEPNERNPTQGERP